jgi:transcriptional regulator with XRE-family HTH domain
VSTRELFAANLGRLLTLAGMSEAELGLALELGDSPAVAASNLRRYLRGERWPRPEQIDRMAEALGVRPVDFFDETP